MSWNKKQTSNSGGKTTVTDSSTNGNIVVDGLEINVYDEITLKNQAHTHSNKSTLDKLSESSGSLLFNGSAIGSSGGTTPSGIIDPRNINYVQLVQEATQNIFDKTTVELNGYYDQPNGLWVKDATFSSSALINVIEGQSYTSKYSGITTYWKQDGTYVSYTRSKTFTVPTGQNIYYVRTAITLVNLDAEMFVKDSTLPTVYQPYGETPIYKFASKTFITELRNKSVNGNHFSDDASNFIQNKIENNDLLIRSRGKVNLFIETSFEGYNQPIHPKMLYFSNGWNGYKYWLAYTPYPFGIAGVENPSITVSNDLIKWITPQGLTNPLDNPSDGTQSYWSDTHLVYRSDLNRLECWYRGVQEQGATFSSNKVTICRRTTTDGINWTTREIIHEVPNSASFVSHAVIYDNNVYKIWVAGGGGGYFESTDGTNWVNKGSVSFVGTSPTIWHWDITKTDIGYEMVFMENSAYSNKIMYYNSTDGLKFDNGKEIIHNSDLIGGIDSGGLYRPSLLKINGYYYLIYTTIDSNGVRGLTLSVTSKPNDINTFYGINMEHTQLMSKPTRKPRWARLGTTYFDPSINKVLICTFEGTSTRDAEWRDFNGNLV